MSKKNIADGVTEPTVDAEQLRWALSVVTAINNGHDQPDDDTLNAYNIIEEALRNRNWIMYVP